MHILSYLNQTRPDVAWVTDADENGNYNWDRTLPRQNEIEGLVAKYIRFGKDEPEPVDHRHAMRMAQAFGQGVMLEMIVEAKKNGFDTYQKKHVVLKAMRDVFFYLQIGYIAGAIEMIRQIPDTDFDSTFLNTTILLKYINKCETFLRLPNSTSFYI